MTPLSAFVALASVAGAFAPARAPRARAAARAARARARAMKYLAARTGRWPRPHAAMNGERPRWSVRSTSTSSVSRKRATSVWPSAHAAMKGVNPSSPARFGSSPRSCSRRTSSRLPCAHASSMGCEPGFDGPSWWRGFTPGVRTRSGDAAAAAAAAAFSAALNGFVGSRISTFSFFSFGGLVGVPLRRGEAVFRLMAVPTTTTETTMGARLHPFPWPVKLRRERAPIYWCKRRREGRACVSVYGFRTKVRKEAPFN